MECSFICINVWAFIVFQAWEYYFFLSQAGKLAPWTHPSGSSPFPPSPTRGYFRGGGVVVISSLFFGLACCKRADKYSSGHIYVHMCVCVCLSQDFKFASSGFFLFVLNMYFGQGDGSSFHLRWHSRPLLLHSLVFIENHFPFRQLSSFIKALKWS